MASAPDGQALVLIGEDEPDNQIILQTVVESLVGVRAEVAGNGLAVLASVSRKRPTVILLDLMMPVMNGFDFIRELRKNKEWQDIPVVILTAKDLTVEDRQQLKGNVERILQKGDYNREQLLSEVRELVKHQVQPEAPAKS